MRVRVRQGDSVFDYDETQLPVSVGGEDADIALKGIGSDAPAAYLGLAEGELFVQPAEEGSPVLCNGTHLTASRWLADGDLLRLGDQRLECSIREEEVRLDVSRVEPRAVDERPQVLPPLKDGGAAELGPKVEPVPFSPSPMTLGDGDRRWRPRATWLLALPLAAMGLGAWFLFTARSVGVEVTPSADEMTLEGGLLRPRLGGRFLLRTGSYRLVVERAGYRRLERALEVTDQARQDFRFELEPLPGALSIVTGDVQGVRVSVDGRDVGVTPLDEIELPRGEYEVRIAAEGYVELVERITVEGAGRRQVFEAELVPLWATVEFSSQPPRATVVVDGESLGTTPLTERVLAGSHRLEIKLAGRRTHRQRFEVAPNQPLVVPLVRLEPATAGLALTTEPDGATVSLDGGFAGVTPIELTLRPGQTHEIKILKAGFEEVVRLVELAAGESEELALELQPLYGEIRIQASPADAILLVDGEVMGTASQTLRLTVGEHEIEVQKDGFGDFRQVVKPRKDTSQTLFVTLKRTSEIEKSEIRQVIVTAQGQELKLIQGGRLIMGAPRREPGRRANEAQRRAEITKPFYLATQEVSNRQFREFEASHRSGAAAHINLEIDHHPVVRVTWEDAARYCNWLSKQDSLPPFYVARGGRLEPTRPLTAGYRLPLESEWAWAARYPDGKGPLKYPWGASLPVASGSGNYADASARGVVSTVLAGYEDGFPGTAPVDSFQPNPLGIFNLGGNVAEWVHDLYRQYAGGPSEVRDPMGPDEGEVHVIRGSSWMHESVTELRLSFRDYGKDPRPDVGFRIARFLE